MAFLLNAFLEEIFRRFIEGQKESVVAVIGNIENNIDNKLINLPGYINELPFKSKVHYGENPGSPLTPKTDRSFKSELFKLHINDRDPDDDSYNIYILMSCCLVLSPQKKKDSKIPIFNPGWRIWLNGIKKTSVDNIKMLESQLNKVNCKFGKYTDEDGKDKYSIAPQNYETFRVKADEDVLVNGDLDDKDIRKLPLEKYPGDLINNVSIAIIKSAIKALKNEDIQGAAKIVSEHWKKEGNVFDGTNISGVKAKYDNSNLDKIITAINSKPFIILAGVSGTGKTQIARLVAGVMSKGEI